MGFSDILAQESAIGTLQRALTSGRVAHAYLFSGPSGVGKRLTATAMAMALNCLERSDDSCGQCIGCSKITKEIHPDVFSLTLPENRKSIPVDSVRELEQRLAMRPHEGAAKVAVVDPADRMTEAAANALLKTLEEPKPNRFIILVTARLSSMLPTVRSRCQVVRFNALPRETVETLLNRMGEPPERAATAAAFSMGSLDRARAYLEDALDERIEDLLGFLESAVDQTPIKGLEVIEKRKGQTKARESALGLIEMAPTLLSEILWITTGPPETATERPLARLLGDRLLGVARKLSIQRIAAFTFLFHKAHEAIMNNNMNPQLALESVLIRSRRSGPALGSEFRQR